MTVSRRQSVAAPDVAARITASNTALTTFAPTTRLTIAESGHVLVTWSSTYGTTRTRRWLTRGNDWYPVWYRHWGHGGTAAAALAQLVRWIRGRPVLGLTTWQYWGSDTCQLLRQGGGPDFAIQALRAAGYPEQSTCVLCGQTGHCGDWWNLNGVSGPCCSWQSGCRQRSPT